MFNKHLLKHFKFLKDSFGSFASNILLDVNTFTVYAETQGRIITLYPTFLYATDDFIRYESDFHKNVKEFKGWKHYPTQTVEGIKNKLETKSYLEECGIVVPRCSTDINCSMQNIIVKREISSFADAISGPFRQASEYRVDRLLGEYYEEFILGSILKVWFWNEQPILVEMQEMPSVIGNGVDTIYELLTSREELRIVFCYERVEEVLSYYGLTPDTVLERDREQIVDFRYGSPAARPRPVDEFVCPIDDNSVLQNQLEHLGQVIWDRIQREVEPGFITTADAILDDKNNLYVLEVNGNPEVHPVMYEAIGLHLQNILV